MAFPQVSDADTQSGTVVANDSTWDLTYPTNLANGNLILAILGTDGNTITATGPAGWIFRSGSDGTASLIIAKKLSDGTETGTFTFTLSGSEQGCWRTLRITGWQETIGTNFTNDNPQTGAVACAPPPRRRPWDGAFGVGGRICRSIRVHDGRLRGLDCICYRHPTRGRRHERPGRERRRDRSREHRQHRPRPERWAQQRYRDGECRCRERPACRRQCGRSRRRP